MTHPKILIVDDEPFNVDYLEQELEELNYETISATNGQEALDKVRGASPDVILLDIMMPVMDGFETLSRLKASPHTRDIPVIIISAMNDLQRLVKGIPPPGGYSRHHYFRSKSSSAVFESLTQYNLPMSCQSVSAFLIKGAHHS